MRYRALRLWPLCLWAAAAPARAGELRWELALEAGSEYDSNFRLLQQGAEGAAAGEAGSAAAPVARAGSRLQLDWAGRRQGAALDAFVGAKMHGAGGQSEDVAIVQAAGRYQHRLRDSAVLAAALSYHDLLGHNLLDRAGGGSGGRNYASAGAALELAVSGPAGHRLVGLVGVRDFRYKPDEEFDWTGEQYGLLHRATVWRGDDGEEPRQLEVSTGYKLERRAYQGQALGNICPDGHVQPGCAAPSGRRRSDFNHRLTLDLSYGGESIWSGRYELERNDSSSFGPYSYLRHRLELGVTTELPAALFLTAKVAVQFNTFDQPLYLADSADGDTFLSIEEENRNALLLHLERELGRRLSLELRYSFFTNEFTSEQVGFRRHVLYAGLVCSFGS